MKIGMSVKDDGEILREIVDQRIVDHALQAVYKGISDVKWSFGKGQSWNEKEYQGVEGSKDAKQGG